MKILVVEDDYITSEVMREIMTSFGECIVAENGAKAVEMFKDAIISGEPFDCIFLDIMMPELDGQETLNQIRQSEYALGIKGLDCVKVVMTTALDDFENISNAFKYQCEGYLVKPVDKDRVTKVLIDLDLLT